MEAVETKSKPKKAPWRPWQEILALDFYIRMPQAAHTDSHPACKLLAKQLGRTASAVEMRLRNTRSADTGGSGLSHVAPSIRKLLETKRREEVLAEAGSIRQERGLAKIEFENRVQ